ncbi:MAG: adenylate/guanylate cyclase domain-containing protein [Enterobacterales bacterium]|nr:adenylate/guanylate cyclase domain-containing protein [Enterobacterales bacterium]
MNNDSQEIDACTVLFADVAGSTHIYDKMGDVTANQIISKVLHLMQTIAEAHQGRLVKTIGDEIMCRFDEVDMAAKTAIAIQEKLNLSLIQGTIVSVRIGFHTGPAILQADGDVFGDTVNLAARMTDLAKGRQIILSKATADCLAMSLKDKTRELDCIAVKGKALDVTISELVWEDAGVTQMVAMDNLLTQLKKTLTLEVNGLQYFLDSDGGEINLGRNPDCELVIGVELASRHHAKISVQRGLFVISDQSTNGTYLQPLGDEVIFLRRGELALKGKGLISLGAKPSDTSSQWLVTFQVG